MLSRGSLVQAVSSGEFERATFPWARIDRALATASALVIDCNLSTAAIRRFVRAANTRRVAIVVAAVSAAKAFRVWRIFSATGPKFTVAVMNAHEATSLLRASFTATPRTARALCVGCCAESVVVTRGRRGMAVMRRTGEVSHYTAPMAGCVVNALGAGDALTAAIGGALAAGEADWTARSVQLLPVLLAHTLAVRSAVREGILGQSVG
jgi:sugar/nucleoside kinase (ribokinase family)